MTLIAGRETFLEAKDDNVDLGYASNELSYFFEL